MDVSVYQQLARRTSPGFDQDLMVEKRCSRNAGLLHALLGMFSEGGEFADALKKHIIYNKPLDKNNLIEELGDKLWYISLACDYLGVDMADVMVENINKLKLRYPEKFSEQDALERKDKHNKKK